MSQTKKSLEWLEPLVLSEKEANDFHVQLQRSIPESTLSKQRDLFRKAKQSQ
jgi:hypothetical protein